MEKFKLKQGEDFIELNNLLKILGWVSTGGQAKQAISEGLVEVNKKVDTRKRMKLRSGDQILFEENSAEIL
ncbi:MAG: ribosome-associated protein [Cyclobacteriaceae bacterium]|jgi:ribosome-associated protein